MISETTTHIGILYVEVFIESSHSLKDKRMVLKKLKHKIRSTFNVSISELDREDKWQRAQLGISMIGADQRYIDSALNKIADYIDNYYAVELIDHELEFC